MQEPSLSALLHRRDLGLHLVSDERAMHDGALVRPLRWVHSSDLVDPTPFLADDLVLLTTGTQFTDEPDDTAAYVARLHDRGVVGLGFGTKVHRSGIPDDLVAACAKAGIPLFEVPYDTPFIAIARAHAEAIADQAYARRTWALGAQRALAVAALRPRGLESTISELAKRLHHWVGMFDATGALVHEHPRDGIDGAAGAAMAERAAQLISRGSQAGDSLAIDEHEFSLFTLGRSGHPRGVIAIATASLDAEARAVVTSVIAMAGLSLEQSEQVTESQRRLHTQVLASLLLDDPTLARRVLGSLPREPMVVAVAEQGAAADALEEWWDRRRTERDTAVFTAASDEGMVMCVTAEEAGALHEIATRLDIRIGVSEPGPYASFSRAHAQALASLRRGTSPGAVHHADAVADSVLSALATDDARLIAQSQLAPLRAHDGLERSLRVWLEHDARLEQAARALGIHRHTLRSRVAEASALLGADLSTFPARAELWAALRTARE